MTARAASTYRAARRNAARGWTWSKGNYYEEHRANYANAPYQARQWLPFAQRMKMQEYRAHARAMVRAPFKLFDSVKAVVHRAAQRGR